MLQPLSPAVEATDLKSAQGEFESHSGDQNTKAPLPNEGRRGLLIFSPSFEGEKMKWIPILPRAVSQGDVAQS